MDVIVSHTLVFINSGADDNFIRIQCLAYKGDTTILDGDGKGKSYVDSRSSNGKKGLCNKMDGTNHSWNL